MKNDPSAATALTEDSSCPTARPTEPRYCGRQPPVPAAGDATVVSQSGLVVLQLAKPTAHTEALHPRPSLQVYMVLLSAHAGSLQPPQLGSLPRKVSQPGSLVQSATVESLHPSVTHLPCWHSTRWLLPVQKLAHDPQLDRSVCKSTQEKSHRLGAGAWQSLRQ